MSIFDDDAVDKVAESVYKKYFDCSNTMISAIEFMIFIEKHLQPCRKRTKGSFVYIYWNTSQSTIMFVEDGYIKYSIYYKQHPYRFKNDEVDGLIQRYDYSHEPRRYEFDKYNFGEWERMDYYDLKPSDIDFFHNIIFNNEYI